jgi:hypothetical protein
VLSREIAIAIRELVERMINDMGAKVTIGVWEAAEATDADLSQVRVTTDALYRYVPKLSGLTLNVGDPVLLIKGKGTSLVILGKVVGNINMVNETPF